MSKFPETCVFEILCSFRVNGDPGVGYARVNKLPVNKDGKTVGNGWKAKSLNLQIRGEREGLRPLSGEVSLRDQIGGTPEDRSRYPQAIQVCHLREDVSAAVHAKCPREEIAHTENDALRTMQFHGCERHRRGEARETTPS